MRQQLPKEIDPFKLAHNGLSLNGLIQISSMPRLTEVLVNTDGEVAVELKFDIDEIGTAFVSGQLKTTLSIVCERCMQPMDLEVDASLLLGMVRYESKANSLAEQYEPWVIDADEPVLLSTIIEDELLLALPIVPKHEQACLPADVWQSGEPIKKEDTKAESPFAVLSALKKND